MDDEANLCSIQFSDFGPPLAIPALSGSIRRRTVPFPDLTLGRAQIRLPLPPQRPRPKITYQSLQQRSSLFSLSKYAWQLATVGNSLRRLLHF